MEQDPFGHDIIDLARLLGDVGFRCFDYGEVLLYEHEE